MIFRSLIACLFAALVLLAVVEAPRFGGRYTLLDHDHDEIMVSRTPATPERTLNVLFLGNSLTFVHDVPALLVNIASSDPGATTRLAVKAETYPDADLDDLRTKTGALGWARTHHIDLVVLQEHSGWFESESGVNRASQDVAAWTDTLKAVGATPLLFEVWADCAGSEVYTNRNYTDFGLGPAEVTRNVADKTDRLAQQFNLSAVTVGDAFQQAREIKGAPGLCAPDHHHASLAGAYLAALVFYRSLTGRTGAEATYRPFGLSTEDAAALVQANVTDR